MDELDPVLVKQATTLGNLHLDVIGKNPNPNALLANAIKTTQAIYDSPEFKKIAASLTPPRLTTCRLGKHAKPERTKE